VSSSRLQKWSSLVTTHVKCRATVLETVHLPSEYIYIYIYIYMLMMINLPCIR